MIISARCQYALKAVFAIAQKGTSQIVTIAEIAEAQDIPQRYLEGILNELRKAGILEAQRGRGGGYRLNQAPERIVISDIVKLVDGPIKAAHSSDSATNGIFDPIWKKVESAIETTLEDTSFADLLEAATRKSSAENLNFSI